MPASSRACDGKAPKRRQTGRLSSAGNAASVRAGRRWRRRGMEGRTLMALTLTVDGDRWRIHLRGVADSTPGLVPVAKGNGYGFSLARLARKAGWLGVDTLAVGTYEELPEVATRYDGDLMVLTP